MTNNELQRRKRRLKGRYTNCLVTLAAEKRTYAQYLIPVLYPVYQMDVDVVEHRTEPFNVLDYNMDKMIVQSALRGRPLVNRVELFSLLGFLNNQLALRAYQELLTNRHFLETEQGLMPTRIGVESVKRRHKLVPQYNKKSMFFDAISGAPLPKHFYEKENEKIIYKDELADGEEFFAHAKILDNFCDLPPSTFRYKLEEIKPECEQYALPADFNSASIDFSAQTPKLAYVEIMMGVLGNGELLFFDFSEHWGNEKIVPSSYWINLTVDFRRWVLEDITFMTYGACHIRPSYNGSRDTNPTLRPKFNKLPNALYYLNETPVHSIADVAKMPPNAKLSVVISDEDIETLLLGILQNDKAARGSALKILHSSASIDNFSFAFPNRVSYLAVSERGRELLERALVPKPVAEQEPATPPEGEEAPDASATE